MCFQPIEKEDEILRVAKDDIKVFKIVKSSGYDCSSFSYYRDYVYTVGRCYESRLGAKKSWLRRRLKRVDNGIHSYSSESCYGLVWWYDDLNLCNSCRTRRYKYSGCTISSGTGYIECYTSREAPLVRMDCVIPAGARYYENFRGEMVSDKLRVDAMEPLG